MESMLRKNNIFIEVVICDLFLAGRPHILSHFRFSLQISVAKILLYFDICKFLGVYLRIICLL